MIELDEDQDRVLREVSDIVGRAAARRHLQKMRRLGRFGLTVWSMLRPRHFRKWNEVRIAKQLADCQRPARLGEAPSRSREGDYGK